MSDRVLVVLIVVVTTLVLLLTGIEAIVENRQPTTDATNFANCNGSVKLVPVLRLVAAPDPTSPSPTSDTLPLPHTTTQPLLYTQPHGTTPPTTHTTTTQHPQQPTLLTPTPKKRTSLLGKLIPIESPDKHDPKKLDKTHVSLTIAKDKLQLSSPSLGVPSFLSFFSSSSSSTSSTSPPPPVHVPVPRPNLQPPTSTLPPPSPTLPLPTAPPVSSTTPTAMLTLQQLGEKLKDLLGYQIPLSLNLEWAQQFQRPYLERIKAVNHEIVDKVLQAEYEEYEPTPFYGNTSFCYLPEGRLSGMFHWRTLLLLLLQALPQSLEEVEEVAWNPEITDYIFRPEKKAVFDVHGCRECYALDASGVCREMFFCKNGEDVFSRTTRRRRVG